MNAILKKTTFLLEEQPSTSNKNDMFEDTSNNTPLQKNTKSEIDKSMATIATANDSLLYNDSEDDIANLFYNRLFRGN